MAVTLNGITQNAAINSQGNFSTLFNTSQLPASATPYQVTYAYAGDANFDRRIGQHDHDTDRSSGSHHYGCLFVESFGVRPERDVHGDGDGRFGHVRQRRHGAVRGGRDSNYGAAVSLSGGSATIADAALSGGTHTITASYSGDTNFSTSSGTLSGGQTVSQAGTTTTVTSSAEPVGVRPERDVHGDGDGRYGHVRQRRHGAVRGGRE